MEIDTAIELEGQQELLLGYFYTTLRSVEALAELMVERESDGSNFLNFTEIQRALSAGFLDIESISLKEFINQFDNFSGYRDLFPKSKQLV